MGDSKGLRLKPPSPLPQGPVTKIAFKVFVNQTKAYLEQDPVNYLFLQEGCYLEWRPRQEGQRLTALHATDLENVKLTQQANAGREAGRIDLPSCRATTITGVKELPVVEVRDINCHFVLLYGAG